MVNEKYGIFDEMIEGVQIVNSNWQYIYVNNTVATHGKYSKAELLGHTMMEKYPGIENTAMFEAIRQCMVTRTHSNMVNEFTFPDGSKGYFELRMEPITEGVLILSSDVTKQKEAELLLHNTNAILEEKVNLRTSELIAKNKELEQFTYIASHDLQEPIRTVSNYIGILKEDYSAVLDNTALQYLDVITRANQRMSLLTAALLDYSRLGRNKEIVSVSFPQLLKDVLADLSQLIQTSEAEISIGTLPVMDAYEVEMRQLFQNLITNAIKFRRKDTKLKIEIDANPLDTHWEFSVKDNGIGIEKVHFERIFEIFQRLNPREQYEGNGIGLANCKKIAELHKGKISVQSIPATETIFSFTISKNLAHE